MKTLESPDLPPTIEIMDGEHFLSGSLAQFCFRVVAAQEMGGDGLTLQGEVFEDSIVVHGTSWDNKREDGSYPEYVDDESARSIVQNNLFGGEPTLF